MSSIAKIISGGQTGADRGGLDAALDSGVPHGGWCPKGRISEDRIIPERYNLVETRSTAYPARTEANIVDARIFVLFAGQGVPEGQKSLAIEVTLQPGEASFKDADLKAIADKVVAAAAKLGAELRG